MSLKSVSHITETHIRLAGSRSGRTDGYKTVDYTLVVRMECSFAGLSRTLFPMSVRSVLLCLQFIALVETLIIELP